MNKRTTILASDRTFNSVDWIIYRSVRRLLSVSSTGLVNTPPPSSRSSPLTHRSGGRRPFDKRNRASVFSNESAEKLLSLDRALRQGPRTRVRIRRTAAGGEPHRGNGPQLRRRVTRQRADVTGAPLYSVYWVLARVKLRNAAVVVER
jgi:hypothetical protein